MNLTAKDMHNSPAQAYREADKGNTVTINHDRYPDKIFELTARERRSSTNHALLSSYEQGIEDNMLDKPKTYKITNDGFVEVKE